MKERDEQSHPLPEAGRDAHEQTMKEIRGVRNAEPEQSKSRLAQFESQNTPVGPEEYINRKLVTTLDHEGNPQEVWVPMTEEESRELEEELIELEEREALEEKQEQAFEAWMSDLTERVIDGKLTGPGFDMER